MNTNYIFEDTFLGNTLEQWLTAIIIIIVGFLVCKLLQFLNKRIFQKLASKTKNKFDDVLLRSLETPVLWGVMLLAIWIAVLSLNIPAKVHDTTLKAYKILVVLNVTWFFSRLLSSLLEESVNKDKNDKKTKRHLDRKFLPLVRRTLLIVVWLIGGIMALSNAGISVGALLGTLGIGGVAIALASQDTIKNVLSGITIFADQIFKIGDIINLNGVEGTVEDIGLRSTRIRTYEKRLVTIPNYKVTDTAIVNITKEPKRRMVVKLGLVYNTPPEKMKEAINILLAIPERINDLDTKDVLANFTEFGDSALVITYIYNIKKGAHIASTNSLVNFEVLNEFNKAGLVFAYPSQMIYIGKNDDKS